MFSLDLKPQGVSVRSYISFLKIDFEKVTRNLLSREI